VEGVDEAQGNAGGESRMGVRGRSGGRSGISTASWICSRVDEGARERGQEPRSERAQEQRVPYSGVDRQTGREQTGGRDSVCLREKMVRARMLSKQAGEATCECSFSQMCVGAACSVMWGSSR
jgi:hypothetical protein